jgi:hypothetical protein
VERRICLLLMFCAVLCLSAAPAMAGLFDLNFWNTEWSSSTGEANVIPDTTRGYVNQLEEPSSLASFNAGLWSLGGGFSLSMNQSSGNADGTFETTDIDSDTISGELEGTWRSTNSFAGTLSNVVFTDNDTDGNFDGHLGTSVSMSFAQPSSWTGTLLELSTTGTWFGDGLDYKTNGGGVDATVNTEPVPVPPRSPFAQLVWCGPGESKIA